MSKPFVSILMGSDSDLPVMQSCADTLTALGLAYEMRVMSAHRTPDVTHAFVRDADERGCAVFIAAAGLAAHLAGTVAALTVKPVIGVPMNGALDGMDALLSTVQMPGGVPVASVAIGKPGAKNAAFLAAQIVATQDAELAQRLKDDRAAQGDKVKAADAALQAKLNG